MICTTSSSLLISSSSSSSSSLTIPSSSSKRTKGCCSTTKLAMPPQVVGSMDVICGRGKSGFNHPGNMRFRTAVMQALDDYQHAEDRVGKPVIVQTIVSNTYSTGGRFLRRATSHTTSLSSSCTSTWVELTFQEQKDKVRHALRDAIAEMKLKKRKTAAQSIQDQQQQQHHQWLLTQLSNTNHQRSASPPSNDVLPVPLTSSGSRTINAACTTPSVAAHLWQHQAAIRQTNMIARNTTRRTSTTTIGADSGGMEESTTTTSSSSNTATLTMALALQQLSAQFQQQAARDRANSTTVVALQLYQQLQNERQEQEQQQQQRIQEYLRWNADQLAVQRDVIALQAYIANLQRR